MFPSKFKFQNMEQNTAAVESMKNRLAAFHLKGGAGMGYVRQDVEKTKKLAKELVRYQRRGAELL